MNRGQFINLVEAFCKQCGLDEPERILHGGPIAVNDVVFSLIYSEQVNPELVFAYGDFGLPPSGQEREVYRALLEANLTLYDGKGTTFTVSPETGHVVLAAQYALADTPADALRAALVKIAGQAKGWRSDPFFGAGPAGRPAGGQRGGVTGMMYQR